MTNLIIINQSHSLFPQQIELLGQFSRLNLPDEGATLEMAHGYVKDIQTLQLAASASDESLDIVFATPWAALMVLLARNGMEFHCLHNDKRSAREVPDGKGGVRVVHAVSPDGWVIV